MPRQRGSAQLFCALEAGSRRRACTTSAITRAYRPSTPSSYSARLVTRRSGRLAKLREDALVALYQNGERLRPEQGYPLRLFLPGWEGNTSVNRHRPRRRRAPARERHAAEGAALYATRCAPCHGANAEGEPADRPVGSLTSAAPQLTVGSFWPHATTLFDSLRRAMPYDSPGSLSANDVYALTAFLLERNGAIAAELRLDAASLPVVRMPNRDGFESAWQRGP